MGDENSSPDWLPAGWTMEIKVRKHGRKDKCFVDSSSGLKFYSKPEVFRYLNSIEINRPKSKEKRESTSKRSTTKFVVEKVDAEGLPPGWIKELRVKKQGYKIRRDPYYIDPVSGCVFRSMKDVLRYLKTGELGKLASKPKDKNSSNIELEDDKISQPAEAGGQNLAEGGITRRVLRSQSLKLSGAANNGQNFASIPTGDCIPHSEHMSDQCREGAATSCVELPEAKDLEQGGKVDSTVDCVSANVVEPLPEKQPFENGPGGHPNEKVLVGSRKVKNKERPNLPRRTSKRLAGVEVDPTPELKTDKRARRVAARSSGKATGSAKENLGDVSSGEEHEGGKKKVQTGRMADQDQGCPLVLPSEKPSIPQEDVGLVNPDYKAEEKPGSNQDLYLRQSWMDPCIDFAIKTLTGAIPIEDENKAGENTGSTADSWSDPCIEFAIKTLTGAIPIGDVNKAEESQSCSMEMPLGDLWTDPCIEFAVKTLTGAIPVEDHLCVQNYFQQQPSSSEAQGANGSTPANVGLNFQTAADKPLFEQQDLVTTTAMQAGEIGFRNSGDGGLRQHIEGRSEDCPRKAML